MTFETKITKHCLACGWQTADYLTLRGDGEKFLRCNRCNSVYLEKIPLSVADLYSDNYFALAAGHAESNQEERIGYEGSYENIYRDSEFYWAYRLCDYVFKKVQKDKSVIRCLDIGAATGRLLNVFKAAGYQTYGIEFSDPARDTAASHGHTMTNQAVESLQVEHEGFDVVTALEVIEHVENLPEFFLGIARVMSENGIFLGYFPSADNKYFGIKADYHWLHNSFEHLVYPTEQGIRAAMYAAFEQNIFTTTFLTVQGEDVIPNTLVVGFKKPINGEVKGKIAELFRQLNYLNDPNFLFNSHSPAGLAEGWKFIEENPTISTCSDVPYVVALMCSKFGLEAIPNFVMQHMVEIHYLTDSQILDLLAMAMHRGKIHFIAEILEKTSSRNLPQGLILEYHKLVFEYENANYKMENSFFNQFESSDSKIIDERSVLLARYDAIVKLRDAAIAERDAAISERNAAISERNAANEQLYLVNSSKIWKAMLLYKKLIAYIKRI